MATVGERRFRGTCLNAGFIASKMPACTARLARTVREAGAYDVDAAVRDVRHRDAPRRRLHRRRTGRRVRRIASVGAADQDCRDRGLHARHARAAPSAWRAVFGTQAGRAEDTHPDPARRRSGARRGRRRPPLALVVGRGRSVAAARPGGLVRPAATQAFRPAELPLLGHLRFALEALRPEIQQYFIERNIDGSPFDRDTRSIVYERAKGTDAEEAFGTERDLLRPGSEYLTPSMAPHPVQADPPRVRVGGPDCTEPYDMSLLNVSAMSFGSLSANAVLALNTGAQLGGFAHDTGEGGVSEYHRRPGGDLIWEIGTGYFGCRTGDGGSTSGSSPKRPRTHRSNACR